MESLTISINLGYVCFDGSWISRLQVKGSHNLHLPPHVLLDDTILSCRNFYFNYTHQYSVVIAVIVFPVVVNWYDSLLHNE